MIKKSKRIMIVDDEPDFREMLRLMLRNEGFETESAENGTIFLEKVDRFQPDLVTLDVMMPRLTTEEILELMKKKTGKPKIILLTVVRFTQKRMDKLLEMNNIVDYIKKPFELNDLIDAIKKALE